MVPERVFDGPFLRAELFNASAPQLFVSFRQRVAFPGTYTKATPVRSFVDHGFAHLYLQSKENDWYINSDTTAFEKTLQQACARYTDAVAMGFSMGGYAALRFASVLGLSEVLIVSPQVSIHPDVVPWDRRYRNQSGGFKRMQGDLGLYGEAGLRGLALFDPFKPLDRRNAHAIGDLFAGIKPCALAGGGHPATQVLRSAGQLGALQTGLRERTLTRAQVLNLHRNARATSQLYWPRLAAAAERSGRTRLTEQAQARARRLSEATKG